MATVASAIQDYKTNPDFQETFTGHDGKSNFTFYKKGESYALEGVLLNRWEMGVILQFRDSPGITGTSIKHDFLMNEKGTMGLNIHPMVIGATTLAAITETEDGKKLGFTNFIATDFEVKSTIR